MNHNWVNEIPTGKVDISVSLMQMKHGLHFSSHQKHEKTFFLNVWSDYSVL